MLDIRAPRTTGAALRRESASVGGAVRIRQDGIAGAEQLQGKELSYNNLVDLDAAWQLIGEFDAPASAIIKHTNPCGCAESADAGRELPARVRGRSGFGLRRRAGVQSRRGRRDGGRRSPRRSSKRSPRPDYSRRRAADSRREEESAAAASAAAAPRELVVKSISGGFLAQTPDVTSSDRARRRRSRPRRAPTEEEWAALEFGVESLEAREVERDRVRARRDRRSASARDR